MRWLGSGQQQVLVVEDRVALGVCFFSVVETVSEHGMFLWKHLLASSAVAHF